MSKFLKYVLAVATVTFVFIFGVPDTRLAAQTADTYVSYNDFYQDLAPYGQWIDDPKYGNVFSPNVDGSFRPYYTSGHWVMTDYGNTWISDLPWGWACFHYGRWTYDQYYGWLWIPGSDWGPAWVSWRMSDQYYGWAPLGPDYDPGVTTTDYSCPTDWWVFIPPQYIYTGYYYHYWYGPRGNSTIIRSTTFVNNVYENNHLHYVNGPNQSQVQHVINEPVQVYKLRNSQSINTRTHNGEISMYRPAQVSPSTTINGERVRPPNVITAPQPITVKPQSTNGRQNNPTPDYKNDVPAKTEQVGLHVNEAVKAKPQRSNTTNPYEYDVNRPVSQPRPGEAIPQQPQQQMTSRPQPAQTLQRPQSPSATPRPAPAPAQQQRQAPAPQPAARPAAAPAAAPARETNTGRR